MTDSGKTDSDLGDNVDETKLKDLAKSCLNNAEYFSRDNSENGQRLYICFMAIKEVVDVLWPKILHIQENAPNFDFDEKTPGNGYRSFLSVVNKALDHTTEYSDRVLAKRDSVLFRKTTMAR